LPAKMTINGKLTFHKYNKAAMKISYFCILLAALLLLATLMPVAVRADSALKWEEVDKPGDSGNVVVSPSEVSDIAVGSSGVLYAIDGANSAIYRSLDGGVTFEDITDKLEGEGAGLPASIIAVAPDKSGIVAVVTDGGSSVYLSTDGGINWIDTAVPAITGEIQAIAISKEYTQDGKSYWEIAIGTAVWGDNTTSGQVWVYQIGKSFSLWQDQELSVNPATPTPTNGEVSALAYSPGYPNDMTLLVVASTAGDVSGYEDKTWLCIGLRDTTDGTTDWNNLPDFPPVAYPVEIAPAGDAPDVTRFSTSLALPSSYTSEAASFRRLFVSYDREPDADDDVYRLDDNIVVRLDVDSGNPVNISSIAYHGTASSGKLLAGGVEPITGSLTVPVWRTEEPFDASPDWEEATVPPTGPGNAKLGWSPDGDIAYCGTGQLPGVALDESALSASVDDGDKWRQLGLIDTEISLADVAISPDSETLLVTTSSPYGPESVWRSTSDPLGRYWQRVLTLDTDTDAVILRLSQNYSQDDIIYAAEVGGEMMAVSHNGGASWDWRNAPGPVVDLVVEEEDIAYIALPDGIVRKSTRDGYVWKSQGDTFISEINMLALASDGTLFIGSRDGKVAYSSDGGASFSRVDDAIGSGNVQVVADASFDSNGIIYAATDVADEGIWRWTIGESYDWEQIDESITKLGGGERIGGLAVGDEGTLYALRLEPDGGVLRSLNPTESNPEDVEFDLVNRGLPASASFDPTPLFPTLPYLKLAGDSTQNQLWTIDTANELIYKFFDTLCKFGPVPVSPGMEEIIIIDGAGHIDSLTLQWQEITGAREYEVTIYADAGATQELWTGTTTYTVIVATEGNNPVTLYSGTTYYWRVRATQPVESPWSELKPFASPLGVEEWSPLAEPTGVSPLAGAGDVPIRPAFSWTSSIEATGYEFVLARDSGFTEVVAEFSGEDALTSTAWTCDITLDYATSYFWRVRAVSGDSHSQWGVNTFTTEAAPSEITPPTSPPIVVEPSPTISPYMIWTTVGVGAVLFIALVVFIIRTRIKF
jgi:photosystem II stability/assembly factor-like uncharacterized protein